MQSPDLPSAAAATGSRSGPIPSLDGFRALAVGMVFFAHSGLQNIVPGGLGVTIFFVLSGYLITTLMRLEFNKSRTVSFRLFYLRRFLRLMPTLLIVTACAAGLSYFGILPGAFTLSGVLAVLFYLGNYHAIFFDHGMPYGVGVVWSLAVEEHFYLFYPPLALLLLRIGRVRLSAGVIGGLCIAVLAWRIWLRLHGVGEHYIGMATDTRIDAILVGAMMALLRNPWLMPAEKTRRPYDGLVVVVAVLVLVGTLLVRNETFRLTFRYSLQSLAIAPLIYLAIARSEHPVFRWLSLRPLTYLGTVSYTIYLSHEIVLSVVAARWPNLSWLETTTITAAITLIFADLMRRWIDQPFAQLRKRLHVEKKAASVLGASASCKM